MTSEVLVMNRLAVALAADSAVTVSDGRRDKVYNSANKLFMLSRRHPVGVMIYNNSSLLGVPWEAIVKLFRKEVGDRALDTVADYATALTDFLKKSAWLFPMNAQRQHLHDLVRVLFAFLQERITDKVNQQIDIWTAQSMSPARQARETTAIAEQVIRKKREEWAAKTDSSMISRQVAEAIYTSDSGWVHQQVFESFKKYAIGQQATQDVREIVLCMLYKADVASFFRSGIVIAGFGDKQIFPAFVHYHFGGVYGNALKYAMVSGDEVHNAKPGAIETFADSGMANVFLRGITPDLETELTTATFRIITRMTDGLVDAIPGVSQKRRKKLKSDLRPLQAQAARNWYDLSRAAQKESHLKLVHEGITSAPVDQLAHIAAALVNLNSFRKKMSLSPETVGGPVDVAVITKGDGFIWIERKHYFRPELNGHYFRNAEQLLRDDRIADPGAPTNDEEEQNG